MKVAIIGAGISGLYLAWKLAEKDNEVTVFERRREIGKKACSGLFSERILGFIPESRELIQNRISSVLINFPRRALKVTFSKQFLVMSHFELDNLAARIAERSGVKIVLGKEVNSIPEGFDRVIGCDGPASFVRRSLGLPDPDYRLALQAFGPWQDDSDFVETWPIEDGFIWKIPRGKETEYGILAGLKKAKPLFEEFLKKNNLKLERLESAIVPQGLIIPKHQIITLCGDAAGLTKPWSGGGVVWGLTACSLLLKNFPDFLRYENEAKRLFWPKLHFSKIATKMVYCLGFKAPWIMPKRYRIESDFLF